MYTKEFHHVQNNQTLYFPKFNNQKEIDMLKKCNVLTYSPICIHACNSRSHGKDSTLPHKPIHQSVLGVNARPFLYVSISFFFGPSIRLSQKTIQISGNKARQARDLPKSSQI